MNQITKFFRRSQTEIKPLPTGTYQFQSATSADQPYRLHLRLETDGSGLLIVNASTVLHLNQTAAEYAYHLLHSESVDEVVKAMTKRYRVDAHQVTSDYQNLSDRIMELVHTPDLDPITFLDFERADPHSARLSAPLRLDCALTYRTRSGMDPRVAPTGNVRRELSTDEWKSILSKAWEAGIPQVVFTGGEPTTRADLPELIQHAEQLGQVTSLISDGNRLSDTHYLHQLLQAGLDHLMLILLEDEDETWEALRDALPEDLAVTVHLTLTPHNQASIDGLIDKIQRMGVGSVSLSASDPSLAADLQRVRDSLASRGLSLVWDVPVPYSELHPVALEVEGSLPEGAGNAWLYVEPDGDVLPTQGGQPVLGNLLQDPWESIWQAAQARA